MEAWAIKVYRADDKRDRSESDRRVRSKVKGEAGEF